MNNVSLFRKWMKRRGTAAFIFPSNDPHYGEYVPDHWKSREWISGFNGSAGTAVVTMEDAALWTDSRYFLAAEEQLKGTPFRLMKEKLPGTPTIAEWLGQVLPEGSKVGIDHSLFSISAWRRLRKELEKQNLELAFYDDPMDEVWYDRPELPKAPVEIQPLEFAGETTRSKIDRVRKALTELQIYGIFISKLDDIAWLTNLRGTDVHCCPLFVSYMLITSDEAILYIDLDKLTPEVKSYLKEQGIRAESYFIASTGLTGYLWKSILLDPDCTDCEVQWIMPKGTMVLEHESFIPAMKAIKNEAEIRGYRSAMHKDGVAMVRFLRWLKSGEWTRDNGQWRMNGETVTELSIDRKLTSLRTEQPLFRDLSFDTISAYGAHGAVVHYEPTPETDIPLEPRGLLLLDSGAQYQDGTTDITRTISLGPITDEEKTDYTLVLKGHIRLAMVKFPAGASGTQLDALARYAMWQHGINFLHGTGHGVGSYLNVHEGPHQIRMNYMPAPLVAGMTVTNEPGIYKAGKHGCRTENTMLITHCCDGEFGEFLQFEPLTLCPIDTAPIRMDMMANDEMEWLNNYHKHVYEELAPLLEEEEREWLREATHPI